MTLLQKAKDLLSDIRRLEADAKSTADKGDYWHAGIKLEVTVRRLEEIEARHDMEARKKPLIG